MLKLIRFRGDKNIPHMKSGQAWTEINTRTHIKVSSYAHVREHISLGFISGR